MLKRLTRRFIVLFVLLAALVPLSSGSTTPTRRVYCYRTVDDFGYCAMVCCDSHGNCTMFSCTA